VAAGAACLLAAGPARGLELNGRYLGSYVRTETGGFIDDAMQHRYDVGTQSTTPGGLTLDLRTSLQYRTRLEPETSLFRSRFFGDLNSPRWRLHGQFVPWQAIAPGDEPPHERYGQLGLDLTPARLPHLSLYFDRRDRAVGGRPSWSQDRRGDLSYALGGLAANLGFRRLDTASPASSAAPTVTEGWRGGLGAGGTWKKLSARADYDALRTDFSSRERRRELTTHRLNATGDWALHRRLWLGGAWPGGVDPRIVILDIDERSLDAHAGCRPVDGLDLELQREYRHRQDATADVISDYLRFQSIFRRQVVRDMSFQAGYARSHPLRAQQGEIPNDAIYGQVDGRLRRSIDGRAEIRVARAVGSADTTGALWHRLLQVRTFPNRSTRLDITWSKDTLPRVAGAAQRDRQWEVVTGYEPARALSFVASWRRLDGEGRARRRENLTSLTTSWQPRQRVTLGTNWSWRTARLDGVRSSERVAGVDLGFWFPGEYRTQGSWRYQSGDENPGRTYNVSVSKSF
jgi:hypothetical protein